MILDDKLETIPQDENKNIEGMIRYIESKKIEMDESSEAYGDALEDYVASVGVGLERTIDNVYSLAGSISGVDHLFGSFYPVGPEHQRVNIRKRNSRKDFTLIVKNFMSCSVHFSFESGNNYPKEISFFTYDPLHYSVIDSLGEKLTKKIKGIFGTLTGRRKREDKDYLLEFKAKSEDGFIDKFKGFLRRYYHTPATRWVSNNPRPDTVVPILNLVPGLLLKISEERKQEHEKKLERLQSRNGTLNALDIPKDII
jgi:hypothetical protein